jgi:hypothetical protein
VQKHDWSKQYINNPNTILGKATRFDLDCARISDYVKTKHSIGWDGQNYLVFIYSSFSWFYFRYFTKKFTDTTSVKFFRYRDLQRNLEGLSIPVQNQ